MKSLPSLKKKKRYILFSVKGEGEERNEETRKCIFRTLLSLLGELDVSDAHARIISYSQGDGILVCSPEYVDRCIVALACMKKINKAGVFVDIRGVFGTMKDAKEAMQW